MAGTLNKGSLVKGTGGSGGGGASFPTMVTSSGSSLPSASGYQLNDTFLDTTDKKIYKTTADTYEWNTNVTHGAVTIDFTTGIVTDVGIGSQPTKNLQRSFAGNNLWTGNKKYQIKFKLSSFPNNYIIGLLCLYYDSSTYSHIDIGIGTDKKIKYVEGYYSTGSNRIDKEVSLNTILEINKEYTLIIDKNGSNCNLTLLDNGIEIESSSFEVTSSFSQSLNTVHLGTAFMGTDYSSYRSLLTYGEIYLLETSFDFLKASSELSWDSGVAIEDKTEYADKTNGILYLYENDELLKIGSSAPTVLTDQTSTSMALAGNTIYKWTSALTSLSFASAEVSDLETVLYFTTGGTISFTDSSSLKWGGDGSAPSLEANTIYCISIRNGLAEIDTFGTVS